MNTRVDLSSAASVVIFLAAGLVLAQGVCSGRRSLGLPGALGVLGAALLAGGLLLLSVQTGLASPVGRGAAAFVTPFIPYFLAGRLNMIGSFLPVYGAVNWMEVIRNEARSS